LRGLALRNRPSQKPQLWEDFWLALRRRIAFEVSHRLREGWLDGSHVVSLSEAGFPAASEPLRIEVVPREMMNRAMFLYGAFEISETRLVQTLLGPGMTFLDVGANIGYYTLVAARMVGPTGVVHAFEPNRPIRERLEQNVHRNGLPNVVVHAEAVGRVSGELEFFASTWDANQGISSLLPGSGRGEAQRVPSITLDDLAAGLGRRVDLIKMDIEGAELLAIEGGRRLLATSDAPAIIFEAENLAPLRDALGAFGYQIRRLHYTLENGLELPPAEANLESLFSDYEAPNYFASKDPAQFDQILSHANSRRSPLLRMLGRL
jgi:FkbM family methyltransferase